MGNLDQIIEVLKDLDIFSESVQFNSKQRLRKRTAVGAILTFSIIGLTGLYFILQSYIYFSGQIDPKFRQQSFVSSKADIKLNNEMFALDFFSLYSQYNFLNEIQISTNKTYIVYVPAFIFRNSTTSFRINLDIVKCQSPELEGMSCLDVSKIPKEMLSLDNVNKIYSIITIYVYRCQDTDVYKTFVPDNCADEETINDFINKSIYLLNIKIQISQYNTSSYQMQNQYRSQSFQNSLNIVSGYLFKLQAQETKVSNGFLIQSTEKFSSMISYSLITQTFDRSQIIQDKGNTYFCQVGIEVDENITHVSIQYPLYTEILALCNSTLALLLILGSFCRKMAQNLIRRDIFFTLLKHFFSGIYLNIISKNNLIHFQNVTQEKYNLKEEEVQQNQSEEEQEINHNIIPTGQTPKPSEKVFRLLLSQENEEDLKKCDFSKEKNNQNKFKNFEISLNRKKTDIKASSNVQLFSESPLVSESQYERDQQDVFTIKTNQNSQKMIIKQEDNEASQQSLEIVSDKFSFKNSTKNFNFQQKLSLQNKESNYMLVKHIPPQSRFHLKSKKPNQQYINNTKQTKRKSIKNMIQQTDIRLESLNDRQLQCKLEDILFPNKLFKQNNYLESKGLQKQTLVQIEKCIDESLDFFSFYKDILLLKKAIMILLTNEQLAVLQIIGTDFNTQIDEEPINHFKEQYKILQSQELQLKYINQFLQKCKTRQNLDVIDDRMLSSLQE